MKKLLLINFALFIVIACKITRNTTNTSRKLGDSPSSLVQSLPDYCKTGEKYVEVARQKYHTEIRPKTVFVHDFGLPDTMMKRLKAEGYRFISRLSVHSPFHLDSLSWTMTYISDNTYKEYFNLLKDSLTTANHKAVETNEINAIIQQRQKSKRCWWNK